MLNVLKFYFVHLGKENAFLISYQNVILMIENSHLDKHNPFYNENDKSTYLDFIKILTCEKNEDSCYFGECDGCAKINKDDLKQQLVDFFEEQDIFDIQVILFLKCESQPKLSARSAFKRTVARSHCNACRVSLLAMLPMLRITYQSCSPRSPPSAASSADTLTKNVHKFEGFWR